MKHILMLLVIVLLGACGASSANVPQGDDKHFGAKIDEANTITVDELVSKMEGKKEIATKIIGTVEAVCQVKGCWMNLQRADGELMRVTFKDYGFFVPLDIAGKKVVARGVASYVTTSVEDLKHYAEDEGLSAEEIAKITEPEHELVFEADGVIVL